MIRPKLSFKNLNGNKYSSLEKTTLGKCGTFIGGGTPSRNNEKYWTGLIPWVSSSDLTEESIFDVKVSRFITEDAIKNSATKIIPKGGILIVSRVGLGKVAIAGNDICTSQDFTNMITSKHNNIYLAYLIKRSMSKLLVYNQGTSIKGVTRDDLTNLSIYIASLDEQIKIADFLSSVDEKIALQNRKVELLQQYKKGMIQKLFSQKIRFKDRDGNDYPEWNECELSRVAIKINKKNKEGSISNVLTNSATQGIVAQTDYFDREIVTSSNLGGYYVVEIGDFVYNPRISSSAPVGPIKMNKHSLGVMSPLYTIFRFTEGNTLFYQYYFESSQWYDYMKSVANSGARHDRMNITTSSFLSLPIPQPIEEEQRKIAKFLSSIDDKVTLESTKLDKLKQWKQGLLQQMFV